MYLCVLGPSVARGPQPPEGTLLLSAAAAPSMLPLEPFEVGPAGVYSPACKKRVQGAGSAAGEGEPGFPSSVTSLFIWVPQRAFLHLLLDVPPQMATPFWGTGQE